MNVGMLPKRGTIAASTGWDLLHPFEKSFDETPAAKPGLLFKSMPAIEYISGARIRN